MKDSKSYLEVLKEGADALSGGIFSFDKYAAPAGAQSKIDSIKNNQNGLIDLVFGGEGKPGDDVKAVAEKDKGDNKVGDAVKAVAEKDKGDGKVGDDVNAPDTGTINLNTGPKLYEETELFTEEESEILNRLISEVDKVFSESSFYETEEYFEDGDQISESEVDSDDLELELDELNDELDSEDYSDYETTDEPID